MTQLIGCVFLEIFKHIYLTMGLGCGTILDGTFYFWSLKSVQGRADKCCKVHTDRGCHQCLITKNKKYIQENVDAYN